MKKLQNIKELSAEIGLPERTLKTLRVQRKIPCVKVGHRTLLFDPAKVLAALERFEIRAVG